MQKYKNPDFVFPWQKERLSSNVESQLMQTEHLVKFVKQRSMAQQRALHETVLKFPRNQIVLKRPRNMP